MKEIEVKLPFDSASTARERILSLGASERTPRQFEDNIVFDREDLSLKRADIVLRLRSKGGRNVLTLKAPVEGDSRHKVREENETTVAQLYGGYIHPDSTLHDLHLIVSQWNTETNWPYHAMQFVTGVE